MTKEEFEMVVGGIVAGGIGSRMGNSTVPKQFLSLSGKPIIIHTLEKFLACNRIDLVVVGVHVDWQPYLEDLVKQYLPQEDRVFITPGGENRNATINNIIMEAGRHIELTENTVFVTHDAVRPFLSLRIIEDNIDAVKDGGVCDTVIPATDTIVRSADNKIISDIPVRSEMYQGQTPQSFTYGAFRQVFDSMTEEELNIVTDACKMFYLRDYQVKLVEGDVANMKITYPLDYKIAQALMEDMKK